MKKHVWEASWIRKERKLSWPEKNVNPSSWLRLLPPNAGQPSTRPFDQSFRRVFFDCLAERARASKRTAKLLEMRPRAPQNEAKMGPGGVPGGFLADLGRPGSLLVPFWCAPGCSWAPLGALLAALRADLGSFWGLLGRSWDLLSRSWGSCWPPGELFLELFGSLFFNAHAKKRKPRFLLTVHHFFKMF